MRSSAIISCHAAIAACLCISMPVHAAPASPETAFDLPEQDLAAAIRDISLQSGANILAPAELLAGRRAPKLHGSYSAIEALQVLLAGTGLEVVEVDNALIVRKIAETTVGSTEAADIVVTGSHLRGAGSATGQTRGTDQAEPSGCDSPARRA